MLKKLTKSDFISETSSGVVFVDFFAEWCGPCKITSPIIHELASEIKDVKFFEVDVDAENGLASEYGVMSIPTFVILKDGKEVNRLIGARDKQSFVSAINSAK